MAFLISCKVSILQTAVLATMTRRVGTKSTIQFGLICQCVQLLWYAFGTKYWCVVYSCSIDHLCLQDDVGGWHTSGTVAVDLPSSIGICEHSLGG